MFATVLNDLLGEPFHVRVLHTKVKYARFPILEVIFRSLCIRKLEQFNADYRKLNERYKDQVLLPLHRMSHRTMSLIVPGSTGASK